MKDESFVKGQPVVSALFQHSILTIALKQGGDFDRLDSLRNFFKNFREVARRSIAQSDPRFNVEFLESELWLNVSFEDPDGFQNTFLLGCQILVDNLPRAPREFRIVPRTAIQIRDGSRIFVDPDDIAQHRELAEKWSKVERSFNAYALKAVSLIQNPLVEVK